MLVAKQITEGSWTARWGDHVIHIRERETWWVATVWRWSQGGGLQERMQLDYFDGFVNAQVAIAWACDVLVAHGVRVLILSSSGYPPLTTKDLPDMLQFSPAPEIAT
jgi:hypothetical protein